METRSSPSAGITLLLLIKDKSGCPTLSALSLLSPPLDRCLDLYVFVHKALAEVIKPTLGCGAEIFSLLIGAGRVEKLSEALRERLQLWRALLPIVRTWLFVRFFFFFC